jgi:hypothetical protein
MAGGPMNNRPGSNTHKVSDLYPGIVAKLQGRTDITVQQASYWVKRALENLTESEIFEELRRIGPLVTIGPGLGLNGSNWQYPISSFLAPGDDYTLMEDPVIILATTTQGTTFNSPGGITNTVSYPMDYMTPKAIQPLLSIGGGIPFKYTRYGGNFWFGTQPGQPYQVYLPYQIRHPFASEIPNSQLFIPVSWEEIVEYSAAMRGAEERRWPDMVGTLKAMLYGDPKVPDQPGLLKAMKLQIDRDNNKSTRQVIPTVSRY